MNPLRAVLDFIYPPRCAICGEFVNPNVGVCVKCASDFRLVEHPMCTICGIPFHGGSDHICGDCHKKRPSFDKARAWGVHSGALRHAVIALKFGRKTKLAHLLARLMTATLLKEFDIADIDSIIPVPLHKKRLRWRGFNQSLLLAREISSATGIDVDFLSLKRTRLTKPQTRLPLKQRSENVKGAFQVVRANFVKDRRILLVDDVFTSGATIAECALTLKSHGAIAVYALCAVRAVWDEPEMWEEAF